MIQSRVQFSLRNAREYFREHLSTGDYYSQGEKIAGEWFGHGAEKLGLSGQVTEATFLALCEGQHPLTGQKLGQRMNTVRDTNGKSVANRRIFYDFTIAPPKSVSLVGLYQDVRILDLHREAVRRTMVELEKLAQTRVRKSGQNEERTTGNLVTACFRHDTSRELDPHLHTHCVVFNATFDAKENRWKALQVEAMYKAQNFATNYYRHELSKGLRSLGYEIENHLRGFEIKGVPQSLVSRFSKRRKQIDAETCKRIEAGERPQNVKDLREDIAHGKRRQKLKEATAERLRPGWRSQMQSDEVAALAKLSAISATQTGVSTKADVGAIIAWADEHLFERRSVVAEHELLAAALERGRGESFDLAELHAVITQRGYVVEKTTNRLTSREVLRTELGIVIAAKDGRCRHAAFNPCFVSSEKLSSEQKAAVGQILGSRDFITLFRGGAGTGKSFTLKEVESGLIASGRPVVILAPQRQQVADLQADGLTAETLSRFLVAKQLPKGGVVIVDEAGQIGGRQLHELIRVVQMNEGRLILSGDTRQHGAVPASDALRAIEKHAGLKPAVIAKIRRQDPALGESARERTFIRSYRSAVKAAATGDIVGSFDRLDLLGCIRTRAEDDDERREQLAQEYLAAIERKEKVLVVAQTRAEVSAVNETIRDQLRARGKLGTEETITAHQPVDMSEARKRDPRFYQPGQYACFIRSYGRYAKNDLCEIVEANEHGLVLKKNGRRSTFSYRYASRIAVTAPVEMRVAPGDRLQLKFNGKSVEGSPLNNGELVTVQKLRPDGSLAVEGTGGTRKTLAPTQRVFVRGYAVTSYGSQGKTVDTVLIADANNEAATNANQWYVSISRARKKVIVFTPDKTALREHIQRTGDRELALELKTQAEPTARKPDWSHRAREAVEHQRRHQSVMSHTVQHRTQTQHVSL
jgi:conjugative relaxase-like TrwC/TraI family protein